MLVNALLYWAEVEDDSGLPLDSRTLVGTPSGLDNGWDRHRPERKVNRRWVDLAVYDVTPRKIRRRPEVMPAEMDGHSPDALISKLPIEVSGWDWQVKLRGSSTGLRRADMPYEIHLPVVDPPSVMLDAIVHHQTDAR